MTDRTLANIPDDQLWQMYVEHGCNGTALSETLGTSGVTTRRYIRNLVAKGYHLSPGAKDVVGAARLSGLEAKGGWLRNYDDDGKHIGTTRWAAVDVEMQQDMLERIKTAFEGIDAVPEVPAPIYSDDDLLTVYPIADAHIGMRSWGAETGEDYDTDIATQRLTSWISQCVSSSPQSKTAIILDVGDLTHADDNTNQTPASKHNLDVDTRHFRTLDMTIEALSVSVVCALRRHENVIVRILRGNHNENSHVAITFALAERFRDNPRVTVIKEPQDFFCHSFGSVMIAAHHGDKAKPERLVMYMADRLSEVWGRTKHRFLFTGHLHHHKSQDIGGATWEQLRALTSPDAYSSSHAYSARSQLQAITYHRERGEVSRVKVNL